MSDGNWGRVIGWDYRASPTYFCTYNGSISMATPITSLNANQWYCIHFIWRAAGTMDVNINGTQYLNKIENTAPGTTKFAIGAHDYNIGQCFDGYIGDVILYRGELASTQISSTKLFLNNKWNQTAFV